MMDKFFNDSILSFNPYEKGFLRQYENPFSLTARF